MGGADFAAAADNGGAPFGPAKRVFGVGGRVEIRARLQHIYRAAGLEVGDRREAIGVSAKWYVKPGHYLHRGRHGFRY